MYKENQEQALKDPHFHSREKGCDCEETTYLIKSGKQILTGFETTCHTHGLTACRCGWEFGWHGGENSRALPMKAKNDQPYREIRTQCKTCKKIFRHSENVQRIYCSQKCYGEETSRGERKEYKTRKARIKLTCVCCNKEFEVQPCFSYKRFCSKECSSQRHKFKDKKWNTMRTLATT